MWSDQTITSLPGSSLRASKCIVIVEQIEIR
jgi:hypothetical protein